MKTKMKTMAVKTSPLPAGLPLKFYFAIAAVALSANAMKHQVAEYLAAGMDAHLGKPIQIDKLYEMLLAVMTARPCFRTNPKRPSAAH